MPAMRSCTAWPTSCSTADRWCIAGQACRVRAGACRAIGTNTCIRSLNRTAKSCEHAVRRMFDSGRATLRTARSESELNEGWQTLIDLHQRRRRSLGEPGFLPPPASSNSIAMSFAACCLAASWSLRWLELDGEAVAAEYHLAGDNGVIYAYQYRIEIEALGRSPGRLITLAILRQAIAEGYSGFDLLRGDEPYKLHWRPQPRPTVEICVLPGKGANHTPPLWNVAGERRDA